MSQRGVSARYDWLQQPRVMHRLREQFRTLNRAMVVMWRLGFGPMFGWFPRTAGRILVLHHVGRRTGSSFRSPVNFAEAKGSLFCVAAFGTRSDWYKNLMATPVVEAWLPDARWMVEVLDANDRSDRLELVREVLLSSGFAAPAFGLSPTRMSDRQLAEATLDYRLLEIVQKERLQGSAADFRWVWAAACAFLVVGRVMRRRAHRRRTGG